MELASTELNQVCLTLKFLRYFVFFFLNLIIEADVYHSRVKSQKKKKVQDKKEVSGSNPDFLIPP